MMSKHYYFRLLSVLGLMLLSLTAWSQVTTATLTGQITNEKTKETLIGAKVVAVHTPSGSQYAGVTNDNGSFFIPNMRVGGPYTVTVSYVGFKDQTVEGIYLSLGQKTPLSITLSENTTELDAVTISANVNSTINAKRTGASNNISSSQIAALPTISRSAADYTRLSPAATEGGSFGGRNDQYNNFSLNGTIFNNPFGLDAASPGGQTDAQPVSLDAIEQIQVAYAPYDVTQAGFTGASINAVTKSGDNNLKGTVFGFGRNEAMTGGKVDGSKVNRNDLSQGQFGFSLGGPIIKDKLFFFVNAELERRSDLGSAFLAARPGLTGSNVSRVTAADLETVSSALRNKFGYETGAYENFNHRTHNQKGLISLDWNASMNHKVTATFNFLDAFKEKPAHPSAIGRRGPDATTLQFYNSGYRINNKLYSGIVEVKSMFGTKVSNKLQAGYSAFRDSRDPFSQPFPVVSIQKEGQRYIIAGHEPFSIANNLNQNVLQFNDNLSLYLGKHTLTLGAAFEKFSFENAFNLNAYGGTFGDFASIPEFLTAINGADFQKQVNDAKALFNANAANELKWNWSYTNLGQISAYVQDEIQVSKTFTVTVGARMDRPEYFNTVDKIKEKLANKDQTCCYLPETVYSDENGKNVKFDHTVLPEEKPLFSPRVGFNWDIKGDRSMQLRGGYGFFTGRFPFVWIGNQVANPNFFFYCITHPNFQFPQVERSSLGYDMKFGKGWTVSADLMYSRDRNAVMVRNYGLKLPTGTLKGQGDNRPVYVDSTNRVKVFGGSTNAYVFTNANVGDNTNLMLQVQKTFGNGGFLSFGYNFNNAQEVSSLEAEISSDAYDRNPSYGRTNDAQLGYGLYSTPHRFIASGSKKFIYGGGKHATTVSGFFQLVRGGRFSYTYQGDINNDGSGLNDLVYIPTDAQIDGSTFSGTAAQQAAQKSAFKAFIAQDAYMSENRGKVFEKYAALSPWYNNLDLRILQDYNFKVGAKTNTLQFSIDLLNAGSLLSSKLGVRKIPTTTQPIAVSTDKNGNPTYTFDTNLKSSFVADPSLLSRWQLQLGLRYIFGN
jgi:hypothetical protein